MRNRWLAFAVLLLLAGSAQAQAGGCNAKAAAPSFTVKLPGHPFAVAPTQDGCWLFVSIIQKGVAVLNRSGGHVEVARVVTLKSSPTGIVLTHDDKLLIA